MSFYCIVSGQIKGKLNPNLFFGVHSCIFKHIFNFLKIKNGIIVKTYHAYYHMKLKRLGYIRNPRSLSVGHYELCCDNIRGLLRRPNHL